MIILDNSGIGLIEDFIDSDCNTVNSNTVIQNGWLLVKRSRSRTSRAVFRFGRTKMDDFCRIPAGFICRDRDLGAPASFRPAYAKS